MPADSAEHCVITGCIARKLLPKLTYTGVPVGDQIYELTVPYAKVMATRLKGRPLQVEHEEGAVGEILHSWVNDKNEWYMKALIDRKQRCGNDMIMAMLADKDSPVPVQIAELSLTHQGMEPYEVSMVMRGAREGSTVDQVELVDSDTLAAIKNMEYKADNVESSLSQFPPDTPIVMASFTAVRNPAPPVTYANLENAPSEALPILRGVEQMRQQAQQTNTRAAAAAAGADPAEEDEATLMKKLQAIQAKKRAQVQSPEASQFSRLTDKLGQPGIAGDPRNTGNIHSIYENPADDPILRVAGLFENRNVLSKDQMEGGKTMLMDIAQKTKASRDLLAQKDAELAALKAQNSALADEVRTHEGGLEKQRKQTASLLKKLMIKTNPKPTESEEKELDTFESSYVAGNKDAVQTLNPFLVRASALLDAAAATSGGDVDMGGGSGESSGDQGNFLHALQQALNPNQQLVKASAYNKRRFDEMSSSSAGPSRSSAAAAASSSSSLWQQCGVPPHMAAMFQKMDNGGVEDTVKLGELNASKYNRF
jgi:hypothetical protein